MSNEPLWLYPGEAARRIGCSQPTLLKLVEQGRIGTLQISGIKGRKFRAADVDRLVAESSKPATVKAEALVAATN